MNLGAGVERLETFSVSSNILNWFLVLVSKHIRNISRFRKFSVGVDSRFRNLSESISGRRFAPEHKSRGYQPYLSEIGDGTLRVLAGASGNIP